MEQELLEPIIPVKDHEREAEEPLSKLVEQLRGGGATTTITWGISAQKLIAEHAALWVLRNRNGH